MQGNDHSKHPPRWPDKFLGWFCHEEHLEILRGDVYELYAERIAEHRKWKANLLFYLDIIGLCRPFVFKQKSQTPNTIAMFKNYLKVTYRNFVNQKVYSGLNAIGLAIGLACTILICIYINDELSFDKFHSKSDRIYRVVEKFESEGVGEHSASLPFPTGPALKNDFERQVEGVVRFFNFQSPTLALANKVADKGFNEPNIFFADSTFFNVFDFELIAGDKQSALAEPNSVLITRSMAKKYFTDEDPMGKTLEFQGNHHLLVTGVLEDTPKNAHFKFDFIVSFSSLKKNYGGGYPTTWYWNPCWTYIVLEENTGKEEFEAQLEPFVLKYFPDFIKEDIELQLQPIEDIHLHSKLDYEITGNSDIKNVYIFGLVAIFVLIIASINFINLSTARANKRAKEVGVRKSLGSAKSQLISQFIFESIVLTFVSLILAIAIVALVLPAFNQLTEKAVPLSILLEPAFFFGLIGAGLGIGLLAGFYPAFVLSSFKTILVLKNSHLKTSGLNFRRVLVTSQFAISIMLIIGTFIVLNQLNYLQNKDAGFSDEDVVMIPVLQSPMGQHYENFKNTALQSTHIHSLTAVEEIVGAKSQVGNYKFEGMEQSKPFPRFNVRHDFTSTMNIPLVAGRAYDQSIQTDDSLALIVNETLVKSMNWSIDEAVGKRFEYRGEMKGQIVGVVKDYNFASKHHPIAPLVLTLNTRPGAFNLFIKYVAVKIDGTQVQNALSDLEQAWVSVLPQRPFDFFFLDDRLNDSYKSEQKLSSVTLIFSILAILVACLGLFGLATFSLEQRTKEIGVRKVLGISTAQIMVLLSKEFMFLIAVAFIISIPLAYYSLNEWLNGFAFRIGIEVWPFIVAGLITFIISMLTVSYHAYRASSINPANTLKYE
ncbi:putative ABC transport system permease protein [Ekhidna lutea]|uniref:Putative ABC transport system permease protein n=1 Tax=Ekhidna lutea TaxID=447679 RepID=A0A239KFI4_EKHLU|nr:FtsX-like permease family protein [Ekhidna lutea]SNT17126.1 putative ABC transport system permease protein [Ekhidna lutea]